MNLDEARGIIERALEEHKPAKVFGLFSGGNDSLTVTHFAASVLKDRLDGVVHINTGIGLPETRKFVEETCERYGWKLLEYKAVDCGQIYEDMVMEYGFPGPIMHNKMYNRLKERPLNALMRDYKGGRIALISGVRRQESARRMRIKNGECQRQGRRVWIAPFINFSNEDVQTYRANFHLIENPVRKYLCMSGECLCGAFAKPGELKEIETWFPVVSRGVGRNLLRSGGGK